MPTVYNKATDDNDLTFVLKRSIELVKERKEQMANKKKRNGNKERASVSRERRIALALRAVIDACEGTSESDIATECGNADQVLHDLGYGSLIGIPRRLKDLNEQLTAAVAAGDGKRIAELGVELQRAQTGKEPAKVKVKAAMGGE